MMRFEDKVVIITGATAGIGAAATRRFAAQGARLVLVARSQDGLDRALAELGDRARAIAVRADLSERAGCEALVARVEAEFGGAHVLVNNAGANHRGAVERCPVDALARIVDVNLRAPIVLSRLILPLIRQAGGGAIINVASIAGRYPLADEATYSATKFGLRAFTHALAEELAGTGVTASVVSPGPVETGFLLDSLDDVPNIVFSQPMSTADEIAALIVRCAEDGVVERTQPRVSGYLATLGYLVPGVRRALEPVMDRIGRRAKARYRDQH